MFEAFEELGHEVRMDCLPGCNPARNQAAPSAQGAPGAKVKPSLIQRIYWFIAEHSPETMFELVELAYNVPLFIRISWRYLRFRPHLIYERYALNTFAPTMLCKLTGCTHVLEVNDSVVIERSRPLELKGIAAWCEGFCLEGSRLAITITGKFQAMLAARFPLVASRILVLTNAVSRRRFSLSYDRQAVRERLGFAREGATVLGASGQFLAWHGLGELIDQIGPSARSKNLHFLFIGDGPVRESVCAKAEALGIADRVHFTGMVPITKVPEYLAAVDIAVIPTAAQHASPMKLMEYMGAGLPIVAPDLPSIRAALEGEEMAAIFPAGDMGGMRRMLLALVDNPDLARSLGERAKDHVMAELTWTRHAEKVLVRLGFEANPAKVRKGFAA
jgi:glycosyltransferase involved in cell wall biosynthesis